MKTRIYILLTGAFIATAYLAGCGGGSNNNNPAVSANCQALSGNTVAYNQCIANPTAYSSSTVCQTPQIVNNPTVYQQCIANPALYAGCATTTTGYTGYNGTQYGGPAAYPNQGIGSCPISGFGGGQFAGGGWGGGQGYWAGGVYYAPVMVQQPPVVIQNPRGYGWGQNTWGVNLQYNSFGN